MNTADAAPKSLLSRLLNAIKRLRSQPDSARRPDQPTDRPVSPPFRANGDGIRKRNYASYHQYLSHQRAKLALKHNQIAPHDREFEQILHERLHRSGIPLQGKNVLCLGARLGGEVRAFQRLGAFAVGIDLEPGENNPHVLHGDFHHLQFATQSVDVIYCNSLDHAFDLTKIASEAERVLKSDGTLILELSSEKPTRFESIDTSDSAAILAPFRRYFRIEHDQKTRNQTSFVDDGVEVLRCRKSNAT